MNNIEIKNLNKSYGAFALSDVNLNFPAGSIVGLIGENGAGKTTIINCILGLCNYKGDIKVFGKSLNDNPALKNDIGVVFDDNPFYGMMKFEGIDRSLSRLFDNWDSAKFRALWAGFNLPASEKVYKMSKGMKMKAALCIALSHSAKLLVLDEPTAGLDPVARMELLDKFFEFNRDENNTILLSTHITTDLDKVADYIAFVHKGGVEFFMSKDELFYGHTVFKCAAENADRVSGAKFVIREKYSARFLFQGDGAQSFLDFGEAERPTVEDIMMFYLKGKAL